MCYTATSPYASSSAAYLKQWLHLKPFVRLPVPPQFLRQHKTASPWKERRFRREMV